ncbi:MAG: hypothetical protein KBC48_03080 [Candidatus Pacebacteria bacterium]|nr:hypothetical protein [Candidatus Paceibacterota bacterium]
MKYFDKTFWQMSALFFLIIAGTLVAIYYLKEYEVASLNNVDNGAETVKISR